MDSVCVYLQFPRHLDDHSLFFKYRRIRRSLMFAKEYAMISKGALFTGHRWALSPVILFRYALSEPHMALGRSLFSRDLLGELAPLSLVPFRWEMDSHPSPFGRESLLSLPFLLVDAHRVFTLFGPLFYFIALFFFLGTFGGASSFLLLRPEDHGFPTTTSFYSRQ